MFVYIMFFQVWFDLCKTRMQIYSTQRLDSLSRLLCKRRLHRTIVLHKQLFCIVHLLLKYTTIPSRPRSMLSVINNQFYCRIFMKVSLITNFCSILYYKTEALSAIIQKQITFFGAHDLMPKQRTTFLSLPAISRSRKSTFAKMYVFFGGFISFLSFLFIMH